MENYRQCVEHELLAMVMGLVALGMITAGAIWCVVFLVTGTFT
jgi:hypothetical protein